jgi:hypothetical protein
LLKEKAQERKASRPPQAPLSSPTPAPTTKGSIPAKPAGRIPETDLWTMIVQIARSRWDRHAKSFLLDQMIAIKYDTLHGMLTSAVRERGLARHIGNAGFDKVLKDNGARIDYVQPPAAWGGAASVRCCLFPLSIFQATAKPTQGPQMTEQGTEVSPLHPPARPAPEVHASASRTQNGSPPPLTKLNRANGVEKLREEILEWANQLLLQGKVLSFDGKKAVKVSDLCLFYPPWNEREMGQHLRLLGIATARPWILSEKGKVTVWFAWD